MLPHHKPIISIPRNSNGNNEIKILIRAIRLGDSHIIIHPCCTEIRPSKRIRQCPLCTNRPYIYRPIHENSISFQKITKLLKSFRKILNKIFNQLMKFRTKISLKTSYSSHVSRHSCSTNLLIHIINPLSILKNICKTSNGSCIYPDDSVTNQMVSYSC